MLKICGQLERDCLELYTHV